MTQRKDHNKTLNSGERQVSDNLNNIEKNHILRYKKACEYIKNEHIVMDLGCGCGYGSYMLSQIARFVISIDDSKEAIEYAKIHWKRNNIEYFCKNALHCREVMSKSIRPDIIVAFEIIEHIKDTDKLFELIGQLAKEKIIFSVPSKKIPVKRSKWHWRHFDKEEISVYLDNIGFSVEYFEDINKTLIFIAKRK